MGSLVVTRKRQQGVWVGPDVYVQVIDIDPSGGKVRLRVVAPAGVRVYREELLDRPGVREALYGRTDAGTTEPTGPHGGPDHAG